MDISVAEEDDCGVVALPSIIIAHAPLNVVQDHTPIILQWGWGVARTRLAKVQMTPEIMHNIR